ncbi:hypothetical protein KPL76_07150 [Subtercola sp. PAMC28395]|uniref:hypothetical protein n=1 Tax=Subtercola sp. PAMC28395 TaxID=2846775 RepID=UPI001C0C99C8|nr:hypothetical protein [Subtercola sp. PAMC28395]QWT25113.1 hypothetical protein KPL76_07150 [Subtercola sp. PAMC28395]
MDKDDGRFTVETLESYKKRADDRQEIALAGTPEQRGFELIPMVCELRAPELIKTEHGRYTLTSEDRDTVINFLQDSGAGEIWSDETSYAAAVWFIELIQNGLMHGQATSARVAANANSLELTVIGDNFTISNLEQATVPGGAAFSLDIIRGSHAHYVTVNARSNPEGAGFMVTGLRVAEGDPCVVTVGGAIRLSDSQLLELDSCATVHVKVIGNMIMSDRGSLSQAIEKAAEANSRVIVHCSPGQVAYVNHMLKMTGADPTTVTVTR